MKQSIKKSISDDTGYYPVLFSITTAVFICLLDSHIVRICLPVIATDFGISPGQASWINLAYLLVVAPGLPVFGKISDLTCARKVFISGYVVFITGSMMCGISPNIYMLIVSRILQGFGGVMLISSGASMIPRLIPADKRGVAFGFQATAAGVGISIGAPLGGILTDLLSWRYVFYINVPVTVAGVILALRYIPPESGKTDLKHLVKKLDIAGSIYLYISLFCFTAGLSIVSRLKMLSISFAVFMAAGIVFLMFFIQREKKSTAPLIDISLFSKPLILLMFSCFTGYMLMTGNSFMMPFYLMTSLKLTPARSGLMILFFSLSFSVFSSLAGRFADRYSPNTLGCLGMLVTAGAAGFFAFAIFNCSLFQTAAFLFIYGLAFAFFVAPVNKLLTGYVPENKQGVANGIYRTAVFTASMAGIAIYGSLLDNIENYAMVSSLSSIYLWSVLLPLASFAALYHVRTVNSQGSMLSDEKKM